MGRRMVLALVLALAGCGPTYPKARVVQAVIELCRREYQMDAQAKLIGSTIAVRIKARRLFENPVVITPDMDAQALNAQLRFSKEGLEQLQHVAVAVRRVVLSTDTPINFYLVIIQDADSGQVELHWLGHILDLKQLNAMNMSQGEFLRYRSVIYFRPVAEEVARRTVLELFDDLHQRVSIPSISRHFSARADPKALLPFLLQNLAPGARGGEGMTTLAELKVQQVAVDLALAFTRTLVPISGTPPTVREQGYYFVIELGELRGTIQRIVPVMVRSSPHPALGRWMVPEGLAKYGPPEQWSDNDFYVEEVRLPQFLAEQVARRIRMDLASRPGMVGMAIAGTFVEDTFRFQFRLGGLPPKPEPVGKDAPADPTTPDGFAGVVAQAAAQVVHSYSFTNFKNVAISDVDSGAAWQVSAGQLELYRRRAVALTPNSLP